MKLTPLADRPISQFVIMGQVREQVLPKFASYNLRAIVSPVAAISGGGGRFNADISFMLRGPNLDKLDQYSQHLLNKLKAMPGVVDADSSLIVGKPELRAAIDRQKASDLGVSVSDIAQSLRLLVGGDQVSTYNENGEQYEVHVRANEDFRTDPNGISKLNVPSTAARQHRPGQRREVAGSGRPNADRTQRPAATGDAHGQPQAWLLAERDAHPDSMTKSRR